MFNLRSLLLASLVGTYPHSAGSVGLSEAAPLDANDFYLTGGPSKPHRSRRGSEVAHRRWKRTRAAGITARRRK